MYRRKYKDELNWRPQVERVLGWSRQLFSALACLHSHGVTSMFLLFSAKGMRQHRGLYGGLGAHIGLIAVLRRPK